MQSLRQASSLLLLPSSQASTPARTTPSPQRAATQVLRHASVSSLYRHRRPRPCAHDRITTAPSAQALVQASVSSLLPSSQPSTPAWMIWSPQRRLAGVGAGVGVVVVAVVAGLHALCICGPAAGSLTEVAQASVSTAFPSSHASTPTWTIPSPQRATSQALVQASPSTLLPSSQNSTFSRTIPSPQRASRHTLVQPSTSLRLPSSQASLPCKMPSPHCAAWQALEQSSSSTLLPSSQASQSAWIPSPQRASTQALCRGLGRWRYRHRRPRRLLGRCHHRTQPAGRRWCRRRCRLGCARHRSARLLG